MSILDLDTIQLSYTINPDSLIETRTGPKTKMIGVPTEWSNRLLSDSDFIQKIQISWNAFKLPIWSFRASIWRVFAKKEMCWNS